MNIKPHNLKSFFNWIRKSPVDDIAFNAVKSNADDVARGALNVVDDMPSSISFDDIADTYNYQKNMPQPKSYDELMTKLRTDLSNKRDTRIMNEVFPNYGEIVSGEDIPQFKDFTNGSAPMTNAQISDYVDMRNEMISHYIDRGVLPEEYPFDYTLELYDNGYKFDSTPDYDAMDIRPEKFGAIPSLKNSIEYPDGFTDPDAFARYHTALQQGYMSEGIQPYVKDFQRKPSYASFSLNKPKLNVVDMPELFKILYSN